MKHLLSAKVDEKHNFEFSQEDIQNLDIQQISPQSYHLLVNHKSVKSEIVKSDFLNRKYTVKINSNLYEVEIANELDILIKEMGLSLAASQKINEVKAPMPGMILDIMVKENQEVKEGENLLVLEAMKMENTILAPRDAVIKSISVETGKTVTKNQILIEME
ncbi:MAG: biotin/lipoyl-containing protein [Psychroflexus sp.]